MNEQIWNLDYFDCKISLNNLCARIYILYLSNSFFISDGIATDADTVTVTASDEDENDE